jgi:uncharacterized protein with GYD domain
MPTFISLINWTDQGIHAFDESLQRSAAAKELAQRFGGSLDDTYWTVGQYDLVAIATFPDDETATAFMLALGSQGNVRTQTLRAFNAEEMAAITKKIK